MARATYSGSVITKLTGSIGGSTFQVNHAGDIVRNRPTAKRSKKTTFTLSMGKFKARTIEWNSLSNADRNTWIAFAAAHDHINYYSETKKVIAFNWYMTCNNNLESIGQPVISTAPAYTMPAVPPLFTLYMDGSGVYLVPPAPYALGNDALYIFTTRQVKSNYLKQRKRFRYTAKQTAGNVNTIDLTSDWEIAHNTTYPAPGSDFGFNIVAMAIHIEKTAGLASIGVRCIDGIGLTADGIGSMIIESNFIVS
jgi:hypothetical protein